MKHGAFLVADLKAGSLESVFDWLCEDEGPYQAIDPIEFLQGDDITEVYRLYEVQYGDIDRRLNIQMPEALLEFNRWVILRDDDGNVAGFAGFKTTNAGLKLGLAATDGNEGTKNALKDPAQKRPQRGWRLCRGLGWVGEGSHWAGAGGRPLGGGCGVVQERRRRQRWQTLHARDLPRRHETEASRRPAPHRRPIGIALLNGCGAAPSTRHQPASRGLREGAHPPAPVVRRAGAPP